MICAILAAALAGSAWAAADLPAKPTQYVEDRAGILSASAEAELNAKLRQFERDSSCQVLVATFPQVPENFQMEDFTQRTAEAWGVGQKATDNGVVLFLFPGSRQLRIEVGYGLEGAIPDVLAKRIIQNEIVPAFRAGDFDGGVRRGTDAILAAARGEYSGAGQVQPNRPAGSVPLIVVIFFVIVVLVIVQAASKSGGIMLGPSGRGIRSGGHWGGGGFGGGGWGGGGGGGGGFSGGGGSFGGGGSSGSW